MNRYELGMYLVWEELQKARKSVDEGVARLVIGEQIHISCLGTADQEDIVI